MDLIVVSLSDDQVQHDRTIYGSAIFTDSGSPDTPDSVDYRIDDIATSQQIRDWTPAVPATSTSVLIEGVDTQLLTSTDTGEYRLITFRATKGATTLTESATYFIFNPFPAGSPFIVSLDCTVTPELERYLPLPSSRISRVVEYDNWNS